MIHLKIFAKKLQYQVKWTHFCYIYKHVGSTFLKLTAICDVTNMSQCNSTWNEPVSAVFTNMSESTPWNELIYGVFTNMLENNVCTSATMVVDTSEGEVWAEFTWFTPTRCAVFEVVFLHIMMVYIS